VAVAQQAARDKGPAHPTPRARPPHIHFEVQARFERLVTQMYFPGEPLNDRDRLLASALYPESLVATEATPQHSQRRVLNFDIVLVRG
jgi:protocatechuate 3,4-dioxygenase beta subunit